MTIVSYIIPSIRKSIFASLFSVYHTIRLSRHKKVCLIRQEKYNFAREKQLKLLTKNK